MNSESGRPSPNRKEAAREWLSGQLDGARPELTKIAGDASFRRYFRVVDGDRSWILMDAPPDIESSAAFVAISKRLTDGGIHAPAIHAADLEQGFLLLEDLGDELLRGRLDAGRPSDWFPDLFGLLAQMAVKVDPAGLALYDGKKLTEELNLFPDWYLARHKRLVMDAATTAAWSDLCGLLVSSALEQPQVFVHRDFHSCNLLALPDGSVGVIDFQDGVLGPLTYDFASLIWDRYITWPRPQLETWMKEFRALAAPETEWETWVRWCDWMGLQRNLKVVGIFARLHYRDGKQAYLEMIPRFWRYVLDTLQRYPEFAELAERFTEKPYQP